MLIPVAIALAAVALLDLVTGFAGGVAMIAAPALGAFLGVLALSRRTSDRWGQVAVAANVLVLVLAGIASFVFGGS